MDYNVYAWLARASYCKDSSGIILDFEEKAKANLSVCRLGRNPTNKIILPFYNKI